MSKIIKFTPIILLLSLLVLVGCTLDSATSAKIQLSTTFFDLGEIDPNNGEVTNEFFIKNVGGSNLEIYSVSTSCGCTQAKVDSNNIAPGEQTRLLVTYDPNVHQGFVGEIQRIVYIKSNDPLQSELELELRGVQK